MKYFFDTEFIEWAGGISFVSIGIVCENGRTFYAESCTFDERNADTWVKENVLAKLLYRPDGLPVTQVGYQAYDDQGTRFFGTDAQIAEKILEFIGQDETPEFYAYFASYDWVVFARLFGRLIDKPKQFPMWVIDLKQMMWERGLSQDWKRQTCPDPEGEHDALVDAKWNLELYNEIIKHKPRQEDHSSSIAVNPEKTIP